MKLTYTEENYLKAIYNLSEGKEGLIATTAIANLLQTKAASVTDMVQKLYSKQLVMYQRYQGVGLSDLGKKLALKVLRKHLLWEVFLVEKLKFGWHEIDAIAEQLEHIQSDILINRLEYFLKNPYCSPHGIVIPNADGEVIEKPKVHLTEMAEGESGIVTAIKDDKTDFLEYLCKRNICLGSKIMVLEKIHFDDSMDIKIDDKCRLNISYKIANYILIAL